MNPPNPPRFYFKWAIYDKIFDNKIPEYFSHLLAVNFGPHVTNWGWTSDRLANGIDDLSWIGSGPAATKALAGGAKKLILATSHYNRYAHAFAESRKFRMLSIRITQGPNAAAIRLLNFSDIEISDIVFTDFSMVPPGLAVPRSYTSIFLKVLDPTVDVFNGGEASGPLDHSKEKAEAARTLRRGEFLEDLAKKLSQ